MPGRTSRRSPKLFVIAAAAMAALLLGGCFSNRPRNRIGSLPFPGFLTRYRPVETPEPDSLGQHQYTHVRFLHGKNGPEVGYGTLYTCRAGFLDLAHLRTTVDWTWYARRRIRASLLHGEWSLRVNGPDLTWWDLEFDQPEAWSAMTEHDRTAWIDQVSLRTGQRLAYLIQTWHEIVTWHGHRSTIIIPEEVSAFTYDDVMAHVVGICVAERAIRSDIDDYEDAVTAALAEELGELEVVDSEAVRRATELVHADWWAGRMSRRQLDAGLDDGQVVPWLVPSFSECGDREPESFELPWVGRPCGHEGRIVVDSILLQVDAVRASAGIDGQTRLEEKHFPAILAAIEKELRQNDELLGAPE